MASGFRDKVAIVGMGCSRFGERWELGADGLMVEAFGEALADAGIAREQIEAAWVGNALDDINVGNSALPAAHALRLQRVPVTRVENMCATGTEALRGAAYAVASGAVDIALAIGVEKLKDTGYGGLPLKTKGVQNDLAQSARSCDFGHLGEHVGNGLVVVDDRPCEERRSAPIRERRYEPWRFEWGSDRLLEPEFFGHRVRDRQSGDGTTGIGGSA